jgi:hypothetical protein
LEPREWRQLAVSVVSGGSWSTETENIVV